MEIKWIKTFVVTAKYENFRKTAEELYLTQPAVTKHIQRLEESLAVQLFDRIGHRVVLTAAGHRFLKTAREMIAQYEQGIEDFESWKQGYNRKLVMAVAPQIAASFLPSLLRSFIDEYPDIEVMINVLKSFEIGEEVSSGKADVGLTRIRPSQTNSICTQIHEDSVILVGPYECRKMHEGELLQKYRLITDNHPEYWEQLLHEIKKQYPAVRTMAVNQVEVTKRFIEAGLGVSYLPKTMVQEELKSGKLVEIQSAKVLPHSSTYLVTKIETEEVTLFMEFLRKNLF